MGNKKSTEYPPRWCEYCHYFGEFRGWYVCYRPWLVRIGFLLPETVPFPVAVNISNWQNVIL